MTKRTRSNSPDWTNLIQELSDSFSGEIAGLIILVVGVVALFTLRGEDPWLVTVLGWAAFPFAATLIVLGTVMVLRRYAGYWSAEAVVGAELVLICALAMTFLLNNETVDWTAPTDGTGGGLFGWAIGNLLAAGLGRWPAFALLLALSIIGIFLLVRYTPMIYVVHYAGQLVPIVPAIWVAIIDAWPERQPHVEPPSASLSSTQSAASFVSATELIADVPVQPQKRRAKSASSRKKSSQTAKKQPASKPLRNAENLPPIDLLAPDSGEYSNIDVSMQEQLIESTLDDFNVPVKVVHVESGPTVTQFGVEPLYLERGGQRRKVRVNRIVSLADDLALALAAPAVRIEAPVPGRPYVGIEVPNIEKTDVGLRDLLESREMRKMNGSLVLPLGRDTAGKPIIMDLVRAPHMLIAGQTGAGKSVCINTIINGLLMQHGPESLRFVMVDPKMVELPGYNGIPHLLSKTITDMEQVMGALTWMLIEMDDRYQAFRENGVRNIDAYNAIARRRKSMEPLPYIVLIVDELADLMMTAADDIERQLCRLAQMARATGIHLILATQRPSTDVVTGLIKANFPTRIAFAVTSQIDSRVILDQPGAERLLGRGDMLVMRPDVAKLTRVQGCWVGDDEIERVVSYWKKSDPEAKPKIAPWNGLMDRMDEEDEMILEAMDILRNMQSCSTSMLQRKLRVGYPKAARLMEDLEKKGVVGPDLGGGKGRQVLLKSKDDEDDDEYETEEIL
jgi:S-DNA-T family DNA segregation ATPase FtsK/SpoIIIE